MTIIIIIIVYKLYYSAMYCFINCMYVFVCGVCMYVVCVCVCVCVCTYVCVCMYVCTLYIYTNLYLYIFHCNLVIIAYLIYLIIYMYLSRIILSCALKHVNARNAYCRFDTVISNHNSRRPYYI